MDAKARMDEAEVRKASVGRAEMPVRLLPADANPAGNAHGGVILRNIDLAGAMAAMRHCRTAVVTASLDRVDFKAPARIGEVATFKAAVNWTGRSSMEVGVRVEAENLVTGESRHVATAYLTFVSMGEDGRPRPVPPLLPETAEDERRWREAERRRQVRREERRFEEDSQRQATEESA